MSKYIVVLRDRYVQSYIELTKGIAVQGYRCPKIELSKYIAVHGYSCPRIDLAVQG